MAIGIRAINVTRRPDMLPYLELVGRDFCLIDGIYQLDERAAAAHAGRVGASGTARSS